MAQTSRHGSVAHCSCDKPADMLDENMSLLYSYVGLTVHFPAVSKKILPIAVKSQKRLSRSPGSVSSSHRGWKPSSMTLWMTSPLRSVSALFAEGVAQILDLHLYNAEK